MKAVEHLLCLKSTRGCSSLLKTSEEDACLNDLSLITELKKYLVMSYVLSAGFCLSWSLGVREGLDQIEMSGRLCSLGSGIT